MAIGLKRDRLLRDDRGEALASATRTLQLEAEGLNALMAALTGDLIDGFAQAVELLRNCRGRAGTGSTARAWSAANCSGMPRSGRWRAT